MRRSKITVLPSALHGQAIRVGGTTYTLECAVPAQHGRRADVEWSPNRALEASTAHWVWARILDEAHDRFALVSAGQLVGLFASTVPSLRNLPDGSAYRLDYFEIAPHLRSAGLGSGPLLFALGARASELGAQRVVLGSVPESRPFWAKFAEQRKVQGWTPPRGCIPFVIERDVLSDLKRYFDEARALQQAAQHG